MPLFRRAPKRDDTPVDPNERSPQLGLRYKDLMVLGQMQEMGANMSLPRHVLYYLYFKKREAAETAAESARLSGYSATVGEPLPQFPDQWRLCAEMQRAVLSPDFVRDADNLFQGIADRLGGEFDGWEAGPAAGEQLRPPS